MIRFDTGWIVTVALATAFSTPGRVRADDAKITKDEAQKVTAAWVDGLGKDGLVLKEIDKKNGFKGRMVNTRNSLHVFKKTGWHINLEFKRKITPDLDLATVKKSFRYVLLHKFPKPGLDLKGWNIKTISSDPSLRKGFELLSYKDGIIKLRIRTMFVTIYGVSDVDLRTDGPSAKSSLFWVRKKSFALDLTLEAPLGMAK